MSFSSAKNSSFLPSTRSLVSDGARLDVEDARVDPDRVAHQRVAAAEDELGREPLAEAPGGLRVDELRTRELQLGEDLVQLLALDDPQRPQLAEIGDEHVGEALGERVVFRLARVVVEVRDGDGQGRGAAAGVGGVAAHSVAERTRARIAMGAILASGRGRRQRMVRSGRRPP